MYDFLFICTTSQLICATLDLVILYTPLKNTSKHTCSDSLNLKPPAPLYPLQDFKALYKYCNIIIIIIIFLRHMIFEGLKQQVTFHMQVMN